jgi:hypothetical protein
MSDDKGGVTPLFKIQAVYNEAKSKEAGRPMFDEVEMVEVWFAGDRLQRPCFEVTDEHRERWPKEYEAFKSGRTIAESGTPLEHWPRMTVGKVAELKALGIQTVEALAQMPDGNLTNLGMKARELREEARSYLQAAAGTADTTKMAATIAELQAKIERMEKAGFVDEAKPKGRRKAA